MIEHVRAWAAEHGFELHQDAGRNLVIARPGDAGTRVAPRSSRSRATSTWSASASRRAPTTRRRARIALVRDGDWLKADGTTLGADDGVAIAAMMALAEDESLPHGPLELLMTVAEEVGLEGANAFDGSLVEGRILVNLDSEEDGKLTVGCAGSTDTWIRIDAPRDAPVRGRCRPGRDGERRARRPLGDEHRVRPVERDQGARTGAARGARGRAVPPRLARRREEPQRDPEGRDGGRLGRRGRGRQSSAPRSRPQRRRSAMRSRRPTRA